MGNARMKEDSWGGTRLWSRPAYYTSWQQRLPLRNSQPHPFQIESVEREIESEVQGQGRSLVYTANSFFLNLSNSRIFEVPLGFFCPSGCPEGLQSESKNCEGDKAPATIVNVRQSKEGLEFTCANWTNWRSKLSPSVEHSSTEQQRLFQRVFRPDRTWPLPFVRSSTASSRKTERSASESWTASDLGSVRHNSSRKPVWVSNSCDQTTSGLLYHLRKRTASASSWWKRSQVGLPVRILPSGCVINRESKLQFTYFPSITQLQAFWTAQSR